MISMPSIQIRQQYAQIGMDSERASQEIRQPGATMEITTERPRLEMHSGGGKLYIDQTRAWDALAIGSNLRVMDRIYSMAKNMALQTIGRIVEDGNRMAAIHLDSNVIPELARERSIQLFELDFAGPASVDNVDIHYIPEETDMEAVRGEVRIHIRANQPEIRSVPGKLDIYMVQYNKVEIIPPRIDARR